MSEEATQPVAVPAGVITLVHWTMMPDGSTYLHLWSPSWKIVIDQATGIKGFRSTERWHLCAYSDSGTLLVAIPGCQVKGFAACEANPGKQGGPQVYGVADV